MKQFAHETIIIKKEAWLFLVNWDRTRRGFKKANSEFLERVWERAFRNNGANPATHPIADDEIRIDKDSFVTRFEIVKETLAEKGFSFRQDGFITKGMYV